MKRFWNKVEVGAWFECWPWKASITHFNYGQFWWNDLGRMEKAHRVSYFLVKGEWPRVVRHKCDNPICVNPNHLIGGSHKENTQDMFSRGRWVKPVSNPARGEDQGKAKLTEEKVREIRVRRTNGETLQSIGDRFGVTRQCVRQVVNRLTWEHVS